MKNSIIADSLKILKNDNGTFLTLFIRKEDDFQICWSYGQADIGPDGAPFQKIVSFKTKNEAYSVLNILIELASAATILQLNGSLDNEVKIKTDGHLWLEPSY